MPDGYSPAPASAAVLTLPNAISFARICAVPLAVWLVVRHDFAAAFWLFVAAGASDGIDGWLARIRHSRTALGALLDPVADKLLLVSMYVTLAAAGELPDWLAILVVFRDLLIVGGVLFFWVLGQPIGIRPSRISKINTILQILLVAAALARAGLGIDPPFLMPALIAAVAACTLGSGSFYVWKGVAPR